MSKGGVHGCSTVLYSLMVWEKVRLSTSALAGDPDPNPRVFNFRIAILGSAPVSATR